ncbi:MAG: caspase family protein, partial [Burkholderiaceae bacterium]
MSLKITRLLSIWILASCMALPALAEQRNLAVGSSTAGATENRVALVIGNGSYRFSPLKNPVNDSQAMAAKLKTVGFDVIERHNLTQRQVGAVLREFRSRLKPGSVALFYYAGHGL